MISVIKSRARQLVHYGLKAICLDISSEPLDRRGPVGALPNSGRSHHGPTKWGRKDVPSVCYTMEFIETDLGDCLTPRRSAASARDE